MLNNRKKMKKIFQWQEYLHWGRMSKSQKLNFKRACLFPFLVYLIYSFLVNYAYSIIIIIGIYFFIRFINRKKISK